jgi:uncharacterized cupredoxin-like copper-binding protein
MERRRNDRAPAAPARRALLATGAALALGATLPARAHGERKHAGAATPAKAEQKPFGIAGDPKQVSRTIDIAMSDDMRFTPSTIDVRLGSTLRLRLRNRGKVMHELVIGTPAELAEHAELMKKFPDMEHDEPHMSHVPPAEAGEVVWRFNRAGTFKFACLIPGHFEAGMVGTIHVR